MTTNRWTVSTARSVLLTDSQTITSEAPTGNGLGVTLRTAEGAIINVFNTGRVSVQGQRMEHNKALFGLAAKADIVRSSPSAPASIMERLTAAGLEVASQGVALTLKSGPVVVMPCAGRGDFDGGATGAVQAALRGVQSVFAGSVPARLIGDSASQKTALESTSALEGSADVEPPWDPAPAKCSKALTPGKLAAMNDPVPF